MASAKPTNLSRIPRGTDISVAHLGATRQRLGLFKQGEQVAGVLEAKGRHGNPLYPEVVVLMPRRSSKTTSIWSVLLGRCESMPGYKVVTTAQDGNRARNRWREVARALDAGGFEDMEGNRIRWSNGDESFEWANGSRLWVVAPNASAFRGEAADVMLFDEAGELSPERSADLIAGALPLMDTRPGGQIIVTGTPSKARAGLLWNELQAAREGEPGYGIVDYSLRDDEEMFAVDENGDVELVESVLRRLHPGVGSEKQFAAGECLTTMARLRRSIAKMSRTQVEMEYGCRFPADSATDAVDPGKWAAAEVAPLERPERVGIAFDVAVDGSSASIVYAWRLEDGTAVVELVAHRLGSPWVARTAHSALTKHKGTPIGYDDIGANKDPAAALERMKPKPRVDRMMAKDVMGAAARFANEVHGGRLVHFGQQDLGAAIGNLTWRDVGTSGRAFGQKSKAGAAINPVVAASLALWSFDRLPKRGTHRLVA